MTAITAEQSATAHLARGLACGEQDDQPTVYCGICQWVTDPDDLVDLDGQQVCEPCLLREVPDARDSDTVREVA